MRNPRGIGVRRQGRSPATGGRMGLAARAAAVLALAAIPAAAWAVMPEAPAGSAADVVARGRAVALHGTEPGRAACAACHMADGAGQPDVGIPRLAGLTGVYITDQLGYFASGARQNPAMAPYAVALSPAERLEVAAYFASLPLPPPTQAVEETPALLAQGRHLFLDGNERGGLLACAQCHGPTALGVGDFSPRLAGQSQAYLTSELHLWRDGALRDPKGAFMRSVAGHLSPADVTAVAAFVASLPQGPPAQGSPTP